MIRVYTETTPNPGILKFVCDQTLTIGSLELNKNDSAEDSPLAQELLRFPFVTKVYITANFVAIQKTAQIEWGLVEEELTAIVHRHLEKNTILANLQQQDPFTLYVEATPNPAVMKFVTNKLLYDGIAEVKYQEEADGVPLAKELFQFPYVKEVFISENYISVTKKADADWNEITLELRYFLLDYLQEGKEIIGEGFVPKQNPLENTFQKKEYSNIELQIKDIIREYVQPAVAGDGGNIELIEFDDATKTAKMLLQGACSGCPSSTITLKNGIETMLKEMMPGQVENVEAFNG
ncbi:MAG: NifU family protein [Moheibacter sp.]